VSPLKTIDTLGAPRLVVLGGLILAIACLYWARVVLMPVALALLATFLLSPVVALVRRTGVHRVAAVIVVVTLTVALVAGIGWALFSQLTLLANDLPQYRATIARKITDVQRVGKRGALRKVEETAHDVLEQIDRTNPPGKKPMPVVVSAPSPFWPSRSGARCSCWCSWSSC
jgi:predicted PurR-regulated permease PerM